MQTYFCIVRGINVGGNRIIRMDQLRTLCESLGWKQITTYIQSGNVIFKSLESNTFHLAESLQKAIMDSFHFEVPVLVIPLHLGRMIIENNPFAKDPTRDKAFLHVTFLNKEPSVERKMALLEKSYLPEELAFWGSSIFLYCPNGYGKSRLNNNFLEARLGLTATTRNWKTVMELVALGENTEIEKPTDHSTNQ